MKYFTMTIAGEPIATLGAADLMEAEHITEQRFFRDDLMMLMRDSGAPVWDGKAEITLQVATPEQRAALQQSARRESSAPDEHVVFLVPVHHDDEDDDEGNA